MAGKTGKRTIIYCRRFSVAVIDRMTFDQLMDFEDAHSISLGNSVPENIVSTNEVKSSSDVIEGAEGSGVLVDVAMAGFAPVQRNVRLSRSEVVCEPLAAPAKKIVKVRVSKAVRHAAVSHSNR
jgi:hypothetical protein